MEGESQSPDNSEETIPLMLAGYQAQTQLLVENRDVLYKLFSSSSSEWL